jgi:hypothetical protein
MKLRTIFALTVAACMISLCAVASALAATPNQLLITWTPPASNSDGSTPALIGGYNLYIEPTAAALTALPNNTTGGTPLCAATGPFVGCAISVGNVLTYTTINLPVGVYFVTATTWYCATGGACLESPQGPQVSGTVALPVVTATPKPPATITVTATATATATTP